MTRRRLRLAGLALLVAAGGLGWWLARPTELQRVVAGLNATDPGWRFVDIRAGRLVEQPLPADNVVLAAAVVTALIPAEFNTWRAETDRNDTWPRRPTNRPPADPAGDAAWRAAAEAVAAARKCQDLSRGMADPVIPADPFSTLLPHLDDCRRVADLLRIDAGQAVRHGDPAGAVASLRAVLNIARGIGREPFFVSHLVSVALQLLAADGLLRALAVGELPADGLAAVQAELLAAAEPGQWVETLRDWRASGDLEMTAIAAGDVDVSATAVMIGNGRRAAPTLVGRVGYRLAAVGADHAALLRQFTALLDVARRPPHEWPAGVADVPLPPDDDHHLFARSEAEVVRRQFTARLQHMATLRAVAAAAGCERFRLQHGRWPESLAEVPGEHTDPFTGRPLLLKRLPDGLMVYSVGADGTDDGGVLTEVNTPPAGSDIGCRLWDVTARRPER